MWTAVLIGWNPASPPPRIWAYIRGRYWSAKIDDISLCVTPLASLIQSAEWDRYGHNTVKSHAVFRISMLYWRNHQQFCSVFHQQVRMNGMFLVWCTYFLSRHSFLFIFCLQYWYNIHPWWRADTPATALVSPAAALEKISTNAFLLLDFAGGCRAGFVPGAAVQQQPLSQAAT